MGHTVTNTCFRLTGHLGGGPVLFDLKPGELSVGVLEESDVYLPVSGVSRRHAVLRVWDNEIDLVDVGSKNGTYVNGQRVKRAVLRAGDWVGFGPVVLHVVEVDLEDTEVAISLDPQAPMLTGRPAEEDTETRTCAGEEQPLQWVSLLNELADQLIGAEDPDPAQALTTLQERLGVVGAHLVEWGGRSEHLVVCTSGETFSTSEEGSFATFMEAVTEAGKREPVVLSRVPKEESGLSWAAAAAPGMPPYALVVRGDFPQRIASAPLLEVALRLMLHARPEPVHLETVTAAATPPELRFEEGHIPGRSAAMRAMYDQVQQLLRGDIPVLITGETGVGKEWVARLMHASSDRRNGPFVAINCAAIPSELLETEFFGIERGVATGVEAREGKFQQAHRGILFLDEIGDMSADLQAKVLRALQEMEVTPVGGRRPVPVDVRIFSATNTDLRERLATGGFRRDLYYRIAGFVLRIPPLRQRREDIPLFVRHFMQIYAAEAGKPIRGITTKALRALVDAAWPGNLRELKHEIRRLVYLCPEHHAIDSSMISGDVLYPPVEVDPAELQADSNLRMEERVAELERKLITVALARTRGNRSRAAKLLGISRNGLALKMERLGLK